MTQTAPTISAARTFEVRSPADRSLVGTVPDGGRAETRRAIDAAARALPAWAALEPQQRGAMLHRAAQLLRDNQQRLARLATMEGGKPIAETRGEVMYAAGFLDFFADEAVRLLRDTPLLPGPGKSFTLVRQPVGVAGLITIWNFPAAGVTRPLGAALAAGCTAVVKPPEQTSLTAVAIFEILEQAGLPPGVANLVTALDPEPIGLELLENPAVRKLSFTGSLDVGRRLLRGAAEQIKRVTLELGGHAPFIVFDDADTEAAVRGAVTSKFRNAGQTCVCLNRIYVHRSKLAAFTDRFIELARGLKMGDPLDNTTQIGPLINAESIERVQQHVDDAVAHGATVLLGGKRRSDGRFADGYFYPPTVLASVMHDMRIMREETFGPVAPIVGFDTQEQVLAWANGLPTGLAAFVYTRDETRAQQMARQLEYGIVGINEPLPGAPHVPFGGIKHSGIGKEGGAMGIEEFLDTKVIARAT